MFRGITPQLPVADVAAAQRWYRDVLGLEIAWTRGESFGAVRGRGIELYLAKSDAAHAPTICCVLVDDADFAYAVCRERNAPIVEPIASTPWGTREFTLQDLDGHLLRIGHSTRR
ncbi:MAG TPA: VOC family protein [Myxococcota bacterium]|nr:VOC family protein [Myxococcota bacterium]